jgi:hypothetical protein
MARGRAILFVALVIAARPIGAEPASAHGPCGCLTPASGPAGTTVSAASAAYKVVFNPDRTDLGIGPKSLWRDHRPDVAPTVVFRTTYAYSDLPLTGPVEFQIPTTPRGRYLVSIYDGSEGGAHYTWDYFRVTERQREAPATRRPAPSPPPTAEASGVSSLTTVIVGVTALLTGLMLGVLAERRRRRLQSSKL